MVYQGRGVIGKSATVKSDGWHNIDSDEPVWRR